MEENITSENTSGVAEQTTNTNIESQQNIQQTTVNEPAQTNNVESVIPQQTTQTVQTPEENAKFAQMRRQYESQLASEKQKAKDSFIAEQGYTWNGQPITTEAQYKQALQEQQIYQQAQQQGKDPDIELWKANIENQLKQSNTKIADYEMRERRYAQDEQLSSDPQIGNIYRQWKSDVKGTAEQFNCDYETAFTILTRERLGNLLSQQSIQTEQNTIKGLQFNAQTTPGALGGEDVNHKTDISHMKSSDFNDLIEKVKRGEITNI